MSETTQEDWLRVVYGSGRDRDRAGARDGGQRAEVSVRQSPSQLDPARAPSGEQWVRLTVVPSVPSLGWSLYLEDRGPGPGEPAPMRVWWRGEPGTWQPLGEVRQCVATGRGRTRLDVGIRVARDPEDDAVPPRLRFLAEST